ncbi:ABC transporter substrate-binding protein [Amycolatopsis taiwanensis]|uniref:ABC transporter substrate-binding protein n=1 Tax=Amycolatopsis taiwanensis TaxID=342230 RepID=UPI000489C954|nr:ABC transporter substrate-binding protein [Amycolatopsis taiwanensis]
MPQSGLLTAGISRRRLLAVGGTAALGTLLAACGNGSSGSAPEPAAGGSGPWSFTDDRGTPVTARTTPARVVAFTGTAAALVDFGLGDRIVGVFGETTLGDGKPAKQAGDLDLGKVTVIGNVYGEFSVEKYAALRPDLLVTHMYEPGELWYVPKESGDKIRQLAPTVAINVARVPLTTPIERYAEFARSLGADLNAKPVVDAKARFDAASARLRQAAKASGGLTVMAASGSPDTFYVSNPASAADLTCFAELGVNLVTPEKTDSGGYFESLSWENADRYHADLILLDDRGTSLQPPDLAAKPTWAALPAVRANQVTAWDAVPRFSYAGAAPLLENLAKAIESARKV